MDISIPLDDYELAPDQPGQLINERLNTLRLVRRHKGASDYETDVLHLHGNRTERVTFIALLAAAEGYRLELELGTHHCASAP